MSIYKKGIQMKKHLYLFCAAAAVLSMTACNYNHYDRETSPYRGSVDFQHYDETVERPKKMKTMTVQRDLTTTEGGTVHTRTVTETVTIPEDVSDAEDYKKAQRAINSDNNYMEIDINRTYQRK